MGAELGPGWELHGTHWTLPYHGALLVVRPYRGPQPWVVLVTAFRQVAAIHWPCDSPESAVDIARLLMSVERVSGGANVAYPEEMPMVPAVSVISDAVVNLLSAGIYTPRKARRLGVDLLCAADRVEGG